MHLCNIIGFSNFYVFGLADYRDNMVYFFFYFFFANLKNDVYWQLCIVWCMCRPIWVFFLMFICCLGWHVFYPLWRACNPCSNLHKRGIFSYPISELLLKYAKVNYLVCTMMLFCHSKEMSFGPSMDYYKVTTNKSIQNE